MEEKGELTPRSSIVYSQENWADVGVVKRKIRGMVRTRTFFSQGRLAWVSVDLSEQ